MIVVSDTTPLNYLVLINEVDVLPKLFTDVYAPPKVMAELTDPRAALLVRTWALVPPHWLKVRAATVHLPSTAHLDPGEAEAISLAKEIGAPAVLLDEKKGRDVALGEGLVVVCALALLELAAERQLIDLRKTLTKLNSTTFRVEQDLIDAAPARDTARKATPPEH